jgi:hypothetical protein
MGEKLMSKTIRSILVLKYVISANSIKEAEYIVGSFTHDQIYKGSRPVKFNTRPETSPRKPNCYEFKDNQVIAFQLIEIETVVDEILSNKDFQNLFETYIKKNHKPENDVNPKFDRITTIKILDHTIVSTEGMDE